MYFIYILLWLCTLIFFVFSIVSCCDYSRFRAVGIVVTYFFFLLTLFCVLVLWLR